jgi:hypothetical protein
MSLLPNVVILRIYMLRNKAWDDIYDGIGKMIAINNQENKNELILYHGTSKDGANGIAKYGFENSFFNPSGAWGAGAYFANNP